MMIDANHPIAKAIAANMGPVCITVNGHVLAELHKWDINTAGSMTLDWAEATDPTYRPYRTSDTPVVSVVPTAPEKLSEIRKLALTWYANYDPDQSRDPRQPDDRAVAYDDAAMQILAIIDRL